MVWLAIELWLIFDVNCGSWRTEDMLTATIRLQSTHTCIFVHYYQHYTKHSRKRPQASIKILVIFIVHTYKWYSIIELVFLLLYFVRNYDMSDYKVVVVGSFNITTVRQVKQFQRKEEIKF